MSRGVGCWGWVLWGGGGGLFCGGGTLPPGYFQIIHCTGLLARPLPHGVPYHAPGSQVLVCLKGNLIPITALIRVGLDHLPTLLPPLPIGLFSY